MTIATTNALTIRAYAKINLTLDVFSKRSDGYHSLASVMQAISLHDTLTLTRQDAPDVTLTVEADGPQEPAPIPTDATNLAVRGAQAALNAAIASGQTVTGGVALHLVKRIPSQAGLGGGSSDAAAALVGTNALLGLRLSEKTLHELAASLGSDVPFFLTGGTASARGRGENLSPLPDIPRLWLVIVKPDEGVSTAWAYNELDAVPDRQSHRATKRMEEAIRAGDTGRLVAFQSNDFELPVFAQYPSLAWLHDEFSMAGAAAAHLCGSGSALYGITDSETAAQRIAALLAPRYGRVFVAHTLTRDECRHDNIVS